jgi:hypothetical protein
MRPGTRRECIHAFLPTPILPDAHGRGRHVLACHVQGLPRGSAARAVVLSLALASHESGTYLGLYRGRSGASRTVRRLSQKRLSTANRGAGLVTLRELQPGVDGANGMNLISLVRARCGSRSLVHPAAAPGPHEDKIGSGFNLVTCRLPRQKLWGSSVPCRDLFLDLGLGTCQWPDLGSDLRLPGRTRTRPSRQAGEVPHWQARPRCQC